jgi:hypothetical protein
VNIYTIVGAYTYILFESLLAFQALLLVGVWLQFYRGFPERQKGMFLSPNTLNLLK